MLRTAALCLLAAACAESTPEATPSPPQAVAPAPAPATVHLTLGAFSAAREVLGSKLVPAFQRQRQRRQQTVEFTQVFAGSEELTQTIGTDLAADIGMFAHAHDLATLVARGVVQPTWDDGPHRGIVCRSLVVLAVRPGNPKDIRGFADLVRAGVGVVSPDPATSGGGVWNVCALYGAALRGHAGVPANDPAAARAFVARVLANVVAAHANANESYRAFRDGAGDVAITYESEVALAALFGDASERIVPASTVLVESAVALLDRHVDAHGVRREAQAFLDHLWSPEGQRQFAFCGLRPVDPQVAAANRARFPQPEDLWTIDFLGGWQAAAGLVRELVVAPAARPGK
jgi:sulfate/thiosulfate transport system substrate-binding protein